MPRHLRLTLSYSIAILIVVLTVGSLISYQIGSHLQQRISELYINEHRSLERDLIDAAGAQLIDDALAAAATPSKVSQVALERSTSHAMALAIDLQLQSSNPAAITLSDAIVALERSSHSAVTGTQIDSANLSAARVHFETSLADYTAAAQQGQAELTSYFTAQGPATLYSITALLAVCVAVIGLLYTFSIALSMPLRQIGTALQAIGQGDLEHSLPSHMPREFAPIAHGYHTMRDILRERQHALEIQLRRTSLLTQISIELRETFDARIVAERILRVLGNNLSIDNATIILTPHDKSLRLGMRWENRHLQELHEPQIAQMLDHGLEGWVQQTASSIVLADVSNAERWHAGGGSQQGSAIVLALRQDKIALGSLTVYAQNTNAFSNHDLLLMEGIVAQTSVALSLGMRFQAERQQRDQAIAMLEASRLLTAERSYTDMIALIEEQSKALFHVDHGMLYLQPAGTTDTPVLAGPMPAGVHARLSSRVEHVAVDAYIHGQIATDTSDNGEPSCIALPLISAGQTLGAYVLVHRRGEAASFSTNTWSQLTIFTNLIATACANIQLIQKMRENTQQLGVLVSNRTDELQRSRDLLRVIFDHLPEGLLLLDTQGTILAANNAFCRSIIGRTPRDAVGSHYHQIWNNLMRQSELNLTPQGPSESGVSLALAEGEAFAVTAASWRVLSSDMMGQQRWYAVDRTPIAGPDGTNEQCLERWRDITQQEELQRRLLVHEQLTSLGRLAASIAHEVGNPLQSALGCLELCREDKGLSPLSHEYLDLALGELDRMARTMASLRNLYRPPQITWEPVDLNQLIRQVKQFTQHQLERARVRLSLQLDDDLPQIIGQPDALRQVFLNLVLNAQEAMGQGGQIQVSTMRKPTDRICQVIIHDTGIGMSAEQLSHIFEPFHSMKAQGVGLGLYLSRQIIEQHTGRINIASQPDQGTIITIQFPWSDAGPWKAHHEHNND